MTDPVVLVDNPAPHVRRVTLNRPEKRNALNHALRGELIRALEAGDADPEVRVQIVRGAGKCFSAGYELGSVADGLRLEAELQATLIGKPNQLEAVRANLEKREPRFRDPG